MPRSTVFFNLPAEIQKYMKCLMLSMINGDEALFPYGWEEGMQKEKIRIDVR
jgi:hypothetical protein